MAAKKSKRSKKYKKPQLRVSRRKVVLDGPKWKVVLHVRSVVRLLAVGAAAVYAHHVGVSGHEALSCLSTQG